MLWKTSHEYLKYDMKRMNKMTESQESYTKDIQESVFKFFATHEKKCNEAYELAEDHRLAELYDNINGNVNKNTILTKTSIVVLTANKYERNILHKRIQKLTGQKILRFEINLSTACERFNKVFAYSFKWSNNYILHIHTNVTGSYTIGGSADVIRWIQSNKYMFPRLIVSFGICFGTDRKNYDIGDVIISDKIYPYFIGAKINGEKITVVDDNAFRINDDMYNRLYNLINDNVLSSSKFGFGIKLKSYITGEAVVSSQSAVNLFNDITTQTTPTGDMEGYGVFKECNCSDFKIPCLIVKSISDWGVEKNFDESDDDTLKLFMTAWQTNSTSDNSISKNEARQLIRTLKDRLQAFSANCAFEVLNTLMLSCENDISLHAQITAWVMEYNGAATNCREIINEANSLADKFANYRCIRTWIL